MLTKNQAVSQQSTIELPVFEQVISIEVPVQDIFNKLLGEFPPEYKHKELVSHAVIGSSLTSGHLCDVYNALNGYSPLIDFAVGDMVECTEEERRQRFDRNKETADGKLVVQAQMAELVAEGEIKKYEPSWQARDVAIGKCEVIEINLYASKKLKVRFTEDHRYNHGTVEQTEEWVSHKNCTKWSGKPEIVA